jgi:uncharacterized coiled-coil protein SlyX
MTEPKEGSANEEQPEDLAPASKPPPPPYVQNDDSTGIGGFTRPINFRDLYGTEDPGELWSEIAKRSRGVIDTAASSNTRISAQAAAQAAAVIANPSVEARVEELEETTATHAEALTKINEGLKELALPWEAIEKFTAQLSESVEQAKQSNESARIFADQAKDAATSSDNIAKLALFASIVVPIAIAIITN